MIGARSIGQGLLDWSWLKFVGSTSIPCAKLNTHADLVTAEEQAQLVRGVVCTDSHGGYDAVEL